MIGQVLDLSRIVSILAVRKGSLERRCEEGGSALRVHLLLGLLPIKELRRWLVLIRIALSLEIMLGRSGGRPVVITAESRLFWPLNHFLPGNAIC